MLFDRSVGLIDNTTIKNVGFETPIIIFESDLNIDSSILEEGLDAGILVFGRKNPVSLGNLILKNTQVKNFALSGITSFNDTNLNIQDSLIEGNEIGVEIFDSDSPHFALLEMHNSSIRNNLISGVIHSERSGGNTLDVTNNWWGDASGPFHINNPGGLGQGIVGSADFSPWLSSDPFVEEPPLPECCSSVAFIPGFEASRLYKQGTIFENKLWEPNINADAEKLFLDENGVPLDPSIYTRDIIDQGLGFGPNIYKSFIEFMDSLVFDEIIAEWKDMPYDWRLKISDIVQNPVQLEDGNTYKIVDEIIGLAERSDTGKVTLIGHSNGGLVGKEIVRELERRGKADLVDKLILVAVPQLGTPKAIAGLLHGDGADLGILGYPLSIKTARGLGENMFGVYPFLPSKSYFEKVSDPVVVFDQSVSQISNQFSIYGGEIASWQSLQDFLKAFEGGRVDPEYSDTDTPNVLKSIFLDFGQEVHDELDMWLPPENIEVIQIAGWGLDTIKGIEYRAKLICPAENDPFCIQKEYLLDRRPLFTREGDETVVVPSALSEMFVGSGNFYVNLFKHNSFFAFNTDREHADIFETQPVLDLVGNLLTDSAQLPEYVSVDEPPLDDEGDRIRLSVHSPVSLDIYDTSGNHTGLTNLPDSDLVGIEEQIPNSYYVEFGEGKYVGFENIDLNTEVKFQGTGYGTFTVEIDKIAGEDIQQSLIFENLLVTPDMSGEITFNNDQQNIILNIDVDGNSVSDFSINPQEEFDPILYIEMLKKTIKTLDLKKSVEKQLLQKADKAIKLIEKGKLDKVSDKIKKYIKQVDRKKHKRIADDDKEVIIKMLTDLLNNLN